MKINSVNDLAMGILTTIIFVCLLLAISEAYPAERYTGVSRFVTEDYYKGKLYELNEGQYFQTEKDCELPALAEVVVTDTGSYTQQSGAFSGGSFSVVNWETRVLKVDSCSTLTCGAGAETMVTQWHSCDILGMIGGAKPLAESCNDDSPVYLSDSNTFYIFNTRIFEGFRDTGISVGEVVLKYNVLTNSFDLESAE